ncbi:MAG: peptidase S55, partial [Phycisphaerae bacterium]|nr:peptidase S55 [Phycisphaerae bacterium]
MFSRILAIFLICFTLVGMAQAEKLDRKRYVGIDEIKPGMTGIGKTVLRGTKPVEFFAEVISIIHNFG